MVVNDRWRRLKQSAWKPAPQSGRLSLAEIVRMIDSGRPVVWDPSLAVQAWPEMGLPALGNRANDATSAELETADLLDNRAAPSEGKRDLDAEGALQEFDEHLAAFLDKHPSTLISEVQLGVLAKDRGVDRQKYYRLLKKAGLKETPLEYIRRRGPELRPRV